MNTGLFDPPLRKPFHIFCSFVIFSYFSKNRRRGTFSLETSLFRNECAHGDDVGVEGNDTSSRRESWTYGAGTVCGAARVWSEPKNKDTRDVDVGFEAIVLCADTPNSSAAHIVPASWSRTVFPVQALGSYRVLLFRSFRTTRRSIMSAEQFVRYSRFRQIGRLRVQILRGCNSKS